MDEILQVVSERIQRGQFDFSDLGNVRTYFNTTGKGLIGLDYGRNKLFETDWTPLELVARGIIFNTDGEIVTRPFNKFFNWGQIVNGKAWEPAASAKPVAILEKVDGSMGTAYWYNNQWAIATRGSFSSEQALRGTEMLSAYKFMQPRQGITPVFEIIYPENRIVVDYGNREALVLLALINNENGHPLPFDTTKAFALEHGFDLPRSYETNVESLFDLVKTLKGAEQEGFIVRYNDGTQYKIKGEDYLRLHRLVTNLTVKNVFQAWLNDTAIDIPDEFSQEVTTYLATFEAQRKLHEANLRDLWQQSKPYRNERKAFAGFAVKHPKYKAMLFKLLDGYSVDVDLRKLVGKNL